MGDRGFESGFLQRRVSYEPLLARRACLIGASRVVVAMASKWNLHRAEKRRSEIYPGVDVGD